MTEEKLTLTAEQRCQSYASRFPNALKAVNGRIYGVWVMGNSYRSRSGFYGEFPNSVKERILALFPDCKKIMHLFSGTIKECLPDVMTYDISARFRPTICDSVQSIKAHKDILQDRELMIADPPYEAADFERYGVPPFNKAQVMRDLAQVLQPGAYLAWLDTRKPMYRKADWFLLGEIMVSVSTMHRYRGLCMFQRTSREEECQQERFKAKGGLQ
jgi:hypothetical protein